MWGDRTTATYPLGHVTRASSDANGNQVSATDGNNRITTYGYDAADRQISVTRPDSTMPTTAYNPDGTVARTVDGALNGTGYTYDARGRQTSRTDPADRTTRISYDAVGNLLTLTDPAGRVTSYDYDTDNRPTATRYSDASTPDITGITYDAVGRRTSMTDGTGISTWTYDVFGQLVAGRNGAGAVLGDEYDPDGNQTSITHPSGQIVKQTLDKADRLETVKDWNNKTTSFACNGSSRLTGTTFPNGTTVTADFDDAQQLQSTQLKSGATTLASQAYTRDAAGQVTGDTPTGIPGTARTYQYTALNQLKSGTVGTATTDFAYDAAENPQRVGAATQSFDAANQLCWSIAGTAPTTPKCAEAPAGSAVYSYDTLGNRTVATGPGSTSTYAYDQANQLTGATTLGTAAPYRYDGTGLPTSKTVGGSTTRFVRDFNTNPALLSDGTTNYLYGPDGAPIEQIGSTGTQWFFQDQLGSTRALTDSTGTIVG